MGFRIEQLDPMHSHASEMLKLADTYKQVFARDKSWQEKMTCPNCHANFGEDVNLSTCPVCGPSVPLVEYWTTTQILQDFYHEMKMPHAACFVAKDDDNNIIGFCWGFFMDKDSISTHLNEANGLYSNLVSKYQQNTHFAYQDEIAVLPEWQNKGVGRALFIARHKHFLNVDKNSISFFRTLRTPPTKTYVWMIEKLGYDVVYEYDEERDRVIAAMQVKQALRNYE